MQDGGTNKGRDDCGTSVKMCPMDVRIPEYIMIGKRVLSTECSLCQIFITVCTRNALKVSIGIDFGGKDLMCDCKPNFGFRQWHRTIELKEIIP